MFKIQLADGNGDDGDDDAAANAAANVAATNALLPVNPKRIKYVVGRFQNDRNFWIPSFASAVQGTRLFYCLITVDA